jgi:hypothetical protein
MGWDGLYDSRQNATTINMSHEQANAPLSDEEAARLTC